MISAVPTARFSKEVIKKLAAINREHEKRMADIFSEWAESISKSATETTKKQISATIKSHIKTLLGFNLREEAARLDALVMKIMGEMRP